MDIRRSIGPAGIVLLAWLACMPMAATATSDQQAADFALKSLEGRNVRLSELRGNVVMVNFWTSRCGVCRQQAEALQALYSRHAQDGLRLLSVNFDSDPQRAREFVAAAGIEFPVLLDERRDVSRMYRVRSIPVLVIIDRDGQLRYRHDDYRAGREREYQVQLQELLEE